ncbi:Cytokinin riboside 5'-monophosphate phosphoribohydrolase LOG4 [Capsicum annuum]|uniref:cytokinin riboside 5'-monophosphate phosphoribohydrolase n=1 Tax=Capsicum annuum TaxID=4072 RepID=A0A2G2ZZD3_CAPAN|nr:Cytokinin riboside 5'-monophosphate phosphoribohydrolase LOG4 [Capsicum annuum]PHT87311.1 Cytokinin riboside 5'-monophosphate phosphoribohydrolase LOG4 [Capsicum annuum]
MEIESDVMVSKFKRIYVFCGSSQGKKSSYQDAAIELGKELVSRNIDLIYGGGSIGLMGLVSQAVHDGGRHVIGVIPKTPMPRELTSETVGEMKVVADMYQRKAEMSRHSDAFIALPAVEEGFISPNARQIIISVPTAIELVEKLEEYIPCHERVASKLNWETKQL